MGLIGFTQTLAREGAKYNIKSAAIAPVSYTQLMKDHKTAERLYGCRLLLQL